MKLCELNELKEFNIAIVDDNEYNIKAIERTLQSVGFENYVSFLSGDSFLTYLKTNKKIDLVLLDFVMENGAGGLDVLEKLNEKDFEQIEVLVHTAYPKHINKILSFRKGACYYITKPFDINELILQIQIILTRLYKLQNKKT